MRFINKKFALALGVAALLFSISQAKDGIFVGANVGLPITTPTYTDGLKDATNTLPSSGIGYTLGLDIGYKQYFSSSLGLKYYANYIFSQSFGSKVSENQMKIDATIINHLITANVDFFYNFTQSFGAYVGIGLGFSGYSANYKATIPGVDISPTLKGDFAGSFALPINLGVTYNINDTHAINLGAKIPILATSIKVKTDGEVAGGVDLRNYIVQVGYAYTF